MHVDDIQAGSAPHTAGGHPALAFCNAGTFTDYESFARWSTRVGLLDVELVEDLAAEADRRRGQASHVLHEVRVLQDAIRNAVTEPGGTDGYQLITRMAHQAYADAVLLPGTPARWELGRALETPLYAAALAAVDLLTEVDLLTVRVCPVSGCGNLHLGQSPGCPRHAGGAAGTVGAYAADVEHERAIA